MARGETRERRRGVVAVVIRRERFLVVRRSQQVEAPGAYCFPGGAIEAGESESAALAREMMEELAAEVTPIRPLWRNVTSWSVDLTWWLTEIPESTNLLPNPREIASLHWFTAAEMRALPELLESNLEFLDAHARREFDLSIDLL